MENIQHPAPNIEHPRSVAQSVIGCWAFDVGCWKFPTVHGVVRVGLPLSLPNPPMRITCNQKKFQPGAFSPLTRWNSGVSVIRLMRFSNAGQFVPVKFAEPRQPSIFHRTVSPRVTVTPPGNWFFLKGNRKLFVNLPLRVMVVASIVVFSGLIFAPSVSKTPCSISSNERFLVQNQ
jgi:hypothetical protein